MGSVNGFWAHVWQARVRREMAASAGGSAGTRSVPLVGSIFSGDGVAKCRHRTHCEKRGKSPATGLCRRLSYIIGTDGQTGYPCHSAKRARQSFISPYFTCWPSRAGSHLPTMATSIGWPSSRWRRAVDAANWSLRLAPMPVATRASAIRAIAQWC